MIYLWHNNATSKRIPFTSSLNKPKFALSKARMYTLLLAFLTPLRMLSSSNSWLLQAKAAIDYYLLGQFFICEDSVTQVYCIYISPLTVSRNLLGCLYVLSFQQVSGRLKSSLRTRVSELLKYDFVLFLILTK